MSATHFHLILNHIPVLGTAFGLGLLIFGLLRTSDEIKKAALGIFVIVAIATIPVYLTGEPAEEGVESLSGVSKAFMERHEEAAGLGFGGVAVLGVASLAALIFFRCGRLLPIWVGGSLLAASLVVSGLMAWTANLGGQIRHSEIRTGNVLPSTANESDR
jgi:uncharacterized membrane protein